jgi:SAM-dependent methyltransferase
MDRLLEATWIAEQRHFWYHGFRRFVTPLVEQAVRGREQPRLLDCGCGTGANVDLLARYGQAFGFDYTWSGLAFGRRSGRTRLAQATAAAVPFRTAQFDVVTSFDVLVVLPDDIEQVAVREMHRVLKPGGALVVNAAAMDVLRGDHATLGGEVRRYTRGRLRRLLEGAGFRIERLTHTNAALFPLMLAARTWQRLRGTRAQSPDAQVPSAPVNTLLAAALHVESVLVRRVSLPVGSSVLCLARKGDVEG